MCDNSNDTESNRYASDNKPIPRSTETLAVLVLFYILWMIPRLREAEAGGLYAYYFWLFALLPYAVLAALMYRPLRWLVTLCMDSDKKTAPRIALLVLAAALVTYTVFNFDPSYVKAMKDSANTYYVEYAHEFENPVEGDEIHINVLSGPYFTHFVFTKTTPPIRGRGGIVIDYGNGWYFVGVFMPI